MPKPRTSSGMAMMPPPMPNRPPKNPSPAPRARVSKSSGNGRRCMMLRLAVENASYSTHPKLQWPADQFIINFCAPMADTTDLGFFSLLARQPSLAAAAQALGVTPPAVSRRLAALEKRLGVRLLNRTTRRLSLTPEGESYLEDGEQILRDIERLERSLTESRDTPRGLLRINAGFGFGRRHLGPLISDFVRSYPEVDVVLHLSDRALDLT